VYNEGASASTRTQDLAGRVGITTSQPSGLCLGSLLGSLFTSYLCDSPRIDDVKVSCTDVSTVIVHSLCCISDDTMKIENDIGLCKIQVFRPW
jgi:hypothetical protein